MFYFQLLDGTNMGTIHTVLVLSILVQPSTECYSSIPQLYVVFAFHINVLFLLTVR